jgi:protein TonB
MGYENSADPSKRWIALIPAVLFHVLLVYALTSGLGKALVKKVQQTVVVAIPMAPPPPPPPPPEVSEDQPQSKPKSQVKRPRAFVPKAEVQPRDATPQAGITAVSSEGDTKKVEAEKQTAPSLTPVPEPPKKQPVLEKARLMTGCELPRYPAKSLEKEEEGLVVFRFLVGLDGSVKQAVLVQSSGFERLDQAAKESFEKCKFTPGKIDGEPKETWVSQPFRWKIQ